MMLFICETCVKKDVCKFAEEMEKTRQIIKSTIEDKPFVKVDVGCNYFMNQNTAFVKR